MDGVEVRGDWIVWQPLSRWQPVQLPQDFYLRELMDIAPDDLEAAASIMKNYGMLFEFDQEDIERDRRIELSGSAMNPPDDDAAGAFHKDEVRLHIETAQYAIKPGYLCSRRTVTKHSKSWRLTA
jgi:hypothetical protein